MGHGFAAVKAGGLEPLAKRFRREGFAASVLTIASGVARMASLATSSPSHARCRGTNWQPAVRCQW
jgi:hypothetical protein